VIAGTAADAGLVDIEVAVTLHQVQLPNSVRNAAEALKNSCRLWL
jgi:hypothetical protein